MIAADGMFVLIGDPLVSTSSILNVTDVPPALMVAESFTQSATAATPVPLQSTPLPTSRPTSLPPGLGKNIHPSPQPLEPHKPQNA